MFALKTVVLAFAALAVAMPHQPAGNTENSNTEVNSEVEFTSLQQAHDQCSHMNDGKNQIACCNEEKEMEGDDQGGLLGSLGDGLEILSGNCQPIAIPIGLVAAAVPITDYCNQQVACCSGDQNVSLHSFSQLHAFILTLPNRALSTSLARRSASKLIMDIPDWVAALLGSS